MPVFRMDKWYGDLLAAGGHYLFFYCTTLRLAGIDETRLSVVSAHGDSRRAVTRETKTNSFSCDAGGSRISTTNGEIRFGEDQGFAEFAFPDLELRLRYSEIIPTGSDPMVIEAAGGSLRWFPCALRANVTGEVRMGDERFQAAGVPGYADYVHSHILPPLAPVRTLVWGRFHGAGLSLSYSVLERGRGRTVGKLYVHDGSRLLSFDRPRVRWPVERELSHMDLAIPAGYDIEVDSGGGLLRVRVVHDRAAVASEFVDQDAIRHPGTRAFTRWFSKNPRGVKFLSSASIEGSVSGIDRREPRLEGVGEYVVFGAR
jgi:hypothetical protein